MRDWRGIKAVMARIKQRTCLYTALRAIQRRRMIPVSFTDVVPRQRGHWPYQLPELIQLSFSANEGGQGHRKVAGDLHVLRVVDTRARSGILRLPHASNHGTRGRWLDCSVSGAVSS